MGIETAALLPFLQAGAAIASVGSALMGGKEPAPQVQKPEAPPKPQASKTADRGAALGANAMAAMPGGAMSGNSGTFLTGPGGVDTSTLNLGKNTLLGQ